MSDEATTKIRVKFLARIFVVAEMRHCD